jgi:hypothetical protein
MDPQLTTKELFSPTPGIKEGERFVDLYDVGAVAACTIRLPGSYQRAERACDDNHLQQAHHIADKRRDG